MIAKQVKRAGDRFQRIIDLMGNDSGHSSHRRQSLCFSKSILRFQLSGNVSVNLEDCIAACLERLSTCDSYFAAVAGELGEVSVPFTGLCECILNIAESLWEPGLKNLVGRFAQNLLAPPAIKCLCARIPE